MKIIKNISLVIIVLFLASSCKKDIDNLAQLDKVKAPTNVGATFDITQDNTGLVTIIPNAEGVTAYEVFFGDDSEEVATEAGVDEVITHIYAEEGVFTVKINAIGLTGLKTTFEQDLNITFKAPENLVVTIEKDATNPKLIKVTATADFATIMDMYFGDTVDEEPLHALPGETVSHTYAEAGDYVVRVVAKSAGTATTEHSETVTIDEASDPVNLPINFESLTINYAFSDFGSVVSSVVDNPDASGINTSSKVGQTVKTAGAETWGGTFLTLENPIDFTNKLFKVKVWSPKADAIVKLKVENLTNGDISYEVDAITTTSNEWEELQYDFSAIDMGNEYQKVVIFFDFGNPGDDATYYFDDIKLTSAGSGTGIAGTWKIAPEAGSIGVGPNQGDISWWAIDGQGVIDRACFYDDTYVFGTDGSFSNVLGAETWVEGWQGGTDACGTPVAPHDGSAVATYIFDQSAGTVTLNGTGAYLGIPKAYNGGELTSPDEAPASITYIVELLEDNTVMIVDIHVAAEGADGWWRFKMVKEGGVAPTPVEGTWQIAPEAGSIGVGPNQGDVSWWAIDDAGVADRACFYDDTYVFGNDGSFTNVLGSETWVEGWQGGTDACGTPVAPHDGSIPATFVYDEGAGTVTLNGKGSFLGIPKAYNGGELTSPAEAPESITYIVELLENNTVMIVDIHIAAEGADGWWRFKMVKN